MFEFYEFHFIFKKKKKHFRFTGISCIFMFNYKCSTGLKSLKTANLTCYEIYVSYVLIDGISYILKLIILGDFVVMYFITF
jgi:hypothetical protein